MSRTCELTGKSPMTGYSVSHAMNHTKRRQLPNLQEKTLRSDILGLNITLRVCTNALRTVDKFGGLDNFMLNVKNRNTQAFSTKARKLRKTLIKHAEASAAK